MAPIPHPQTRTVYTTDPQHLNRCEFRAGKQHTHFLIRQIGLAAHLGCIGIEVERIIINGRVTWRVPVAAKQEARRYEQTFRALDAGRKHAEAVASQVTDHAAS